ncbi:helix-turn-helix domain-containing protein [Saccharibacillus endophyticus]|uniref:DNA-binding protein n=1 Tax=Saccharibacillus endophyticus TaxID=2060666 RepID=A0ABQ1ZQZ2_9BACL|nr:helix-turn-helix transcriptional regulator [Saccharibacillus endophyticus]GGH72904.1 hypothetical protein GCM10007362_11490 [Saccharibacillus endophyticus]
MEMTMTLRSEIERGIAEMGMNFSEFGEWSGINRGIFSAILNSNPPKPISLNQLERIAKALGHEEGWMFDLYIDECFYDGRPNRRRVEPFLIRSAELDRIDCIEKVLSRLLEDLKQLEMIFEIGEALYTSGKIKESTVFYQCIVQNEKYHQSERLAVSHYRLFRAALGEDNERNLRAAIEFEPFCDKLPDHHRLDGLMRLFDVYFTLGKLEEAEQYSRELIQFSSTVYALEKQSMNNPNAYIPIQTDHPLVVYYGYGFLSMETIMFRQENFKEARAYTKLYEDLSYFAGLDEQGRKEVEKFRFFSKQNSIYIDLLSGDLQSLEKCIAFMDEHPEEVSATISILLTAANRNDFEITEILKDFYGKVESSKFENSHYNKMYQMNRYIDICYEAAQYYFKKRIFDEAFDYLLNGLEIVVKINNKEMFMKYVPLFEKYRIDTSEDQHLKYKKIMKEMIL